jgi:hypothetical protein
MILNHKQTSPLYTSYKRINQSSQFDHLTNEEVIQLANIKSQEPVTVNADVWYREQLKQELIDRDIIYNYSSILTGKNQQYEFIQANFNNPYRKH